MDNAQMPPQTHEPVFLIEVEKIKPNPHQPRRHFDETALGELASSIREFGLLQPLVVTKIEKETEIGTEVSYVLIAGERRLMAAKLLGLERVPAIIRNVDLDRERLELAIVENVQRADLNPIEEARAYAKLQDEFRLTQREIASRLGKSREVIANALRLLNLPTNIQEAVSKGQVSGSQARLLLMVPELAAQQTLFEDIIKNNLSVRELKSRIQRTGKPAPPASGAPREAVSENPEAQLITRQLEEALGTKVKLETSGSKGKITIDFYSPEELRHIIAKILERPGETSPEFPPAPEEPEDKAEKPFSL